MLRPPSSIPTCRSLFGASLMQGRHHAFLEIFKAPRPLGTEAFRGLRDGIANGDAHTLAEFFVALNRELVERLEGGAPADGAWAVDLCVALADPARTVATLGGLLEEMTVGLGDPVVAVAFEAAAESLPLLALPAGVAEAERQLVQLRVRAMEALVAKSPADAEAGSAGLDAQPVLRYLNSALEELAKGPLDGLGGGCARWAAGFAPISRSLPEHVQLFEWLVEALDGLASAPSDHRTLRGILRILRANTLLPPWHASAGSAEGGGGVGALIVDKAVQVVLGAAAARWRAETRGAPALPAGETPPVAGAWAVPAGGPDVDLWPFNERALEAALVDPRRTPRVRAMAAALLRLSAHTAPHGSLSPRAELYARLFLETGRPELLPIAEPERAPDPSAEEQLGVLLDAMADESQVVRRAAAEACHAIARRQPGGFQPQHYTRLLPFLSDDDPGVRATTMRIFQVLAGFRASRVTKVVDEISARLSGEGNGEDEAVHARRDLELALGITLDRLVDDVEALQQDVHALEARRGELLQYVEQQAMRVGEEIHHEVLNTLTGYLATAIDEADQRESKRRLDDLVAELRRIMNNLYPRDLETEGFLQTVRNRLRDTKAQMQRRVPGCRVELDVPPELTDADVAAALADDSHLVLLYRIVLEAVINARKHASATVISVAVRRPAPGAIEITVRDNGTGHGGPFAENTGMTLMRRRAEEIGADIAYRPVPRGGTAVVVRLARPEADAADEPTGLDAPPGEGGRG
jgi:two-component system nitrate/nitrite sensor histidine kinase NarQ